MRTHPFEHFELIFSFLINLGSERGWRSTVQHILQYRTPARLFYLREARMKGYDYVWWVISGKFNVLVLVVEGAHTEYLPTPALFCTLWTTFLIEKWSLVCRNGQPRAEITYYKSLRAWEEMQLLVVHHKVLKVLLSGTSDMDGRSRASFQIREYGFQGRHHGQNCSRLF